MHLTGYCTEPFNLKKITDASDRGSVVIDDLMNTNQILKVVYFFLLFRIVEIKKTSAGDRRERAEIRQGSRLIGFWT